MGIKNFIKKSISFVSAAAMALTMVAMPVGSSSSYAAEGTDDNLHLSKGIELQSDGNYKITLEAYATGKDTTTTTTSSKPLDIVLVLDQSGSMSYNINNYKKEYTLSYSNKYYILVGKDYKEVKKGISGWYYGDWYSPNYVTPKNSEDDSDESHVQFYSISTQKRLDALKNAVNNFVESVEADATKNSVNHRIAVAGFSSSKYNNTEILSGVEITTSTNTNIDNNNTKYYPDGKAHNGVQYSKNSDAYNTAVSNAFQDVSTTDGQNNISNAINALTAHGGTQTDQGMEMANDILNNNSEKNNAERKKLVIMFTDGEPTGSGSSFNTKVANSAISTAKTIKTSASIYTIGIFDGANTTGTDDPNKFMNYVSSNYPNAEDMSNPKKPVDIDKQLYYKTASDAGSLSSVFEQIFNEEISSNTTVTLGESAVLRDIISDKFELPEGTTSDYIKVYTANSKYTNDVLDWEKPVLSSMKVSIGSDEKTIDVSGFDYSKQYVTANHKGQKLIVEILVNGLVSGKQLDSNDETSGIYENKDATTAVKNFEQPKVDIPEYSYVLDYGKKVSIPNVDKNTSNVHDSTQTKNYSSTTKMNLSKAAPTDSTELKDDYGTFKLENSALTYQPGKINWKGYDSIFTFGTRASDSKYEWYKTNVIPATSVYYEDDFASTETVPEGEEESNIRIVYGGSWNVISSTGNNSQSSENTVYGWEESYKNDTNFSDGSVHYTDNINATATFTFTGTGVDVYSKTDGDVGMIRAQIYRDGSSKAMKTLYIDNISVSGTYYQIPTLSFDGLDYSTYKVVINAGGKGTGGGTTYYLDGIRVYNPLGVTDKEIGTTAKDAYENAGEYNATSKEVRDLLLDVKSFNVENKAQGIVFIDKFDKTVGATSNDIKTFEDYGPKNEVYLKSGQSIAFEIQSGYENLFIGAKSPTGDKIKMTVSDKNEKGAKDIVFSHASDMYYKIDPPASTTNGKNVVVITNNGSSLLSLTKIRATGEGYNMNIGYTPALMSYVSEFSLLDPAETNEKGMVVETPDTDVDIDNPSEEEDKDNNQDNAQQDNQNSVGGFWNKVLNGFKNWFKK